MTWYEKEFEEKMTQYIDEIYFNIFPGLEKVQRSDRSKIDTPKVEFLDKELGIDTLLLFYNGAILTFQEKSRTFPYLEKYNDFTFEFYNDPDTKSPGEWFKLVSQFYFYGFANVRENGYVRYYIIDVPLFRYFLNLKDKKWLETHTKFNRPPAKANFIWISFDEIPHDCIFHSYPNLSKELEIGDIKTDFIKGFKMGDFF